MALLTIRQLSRWFGTFSNDTDLQTVPTAIDQAAIVSVTPGTGTNQGDELWTDERTLSATSENLNIQSGALTNALGQTVTLTKLKGLRIRNLSTTSGANLTITGDGLTSVIGASGSVTIGPGGYLDWSSPIDGATITVTSADVITVNSGAASITYRIELWGVT